ncbi:MAG: 6-carboxytetrahydropterin synthase QueD [Acidobacteriota bacterium]
MYEVKITRDFAAAHRVLDYPGKCEQLHGHNWKVEVIARNRELDNLSMVLDFRKLKEAANQVIEKLDHNYLNEIPPFTEVTPTAENIARYLYDEISRKLDIGVYRVNVFETETCMASYYED